MGLEFLARMLVQRNRIAASISMLLRAAYIMSRHLSLVDLLQALQIGLVSELAYK